MFKPQPPSHAFAFTAGVFCASILVCVLVLLRRTLSINLATIFFLAGPYAIGALLSGLFFWLGLGFSQREPLPRKAFFKGFLSTPCRLTFSPYSATAVSHNWLRSFFFSYFLCPLPPVGRKCGRCRRQSIRRSMLANYSLKRTAEGRLRYYHISAAAAA